MTRTTITKTGDYSVTLKGIDPLTGEPIEKEFWIPRSGGYIRDENDRQVCAALSTRGNTLDAKDGDSLLQTIREEWAAYRRWAKSQSLAI